MKPTTNLCLLGLMLLLCATAFSQAPAPARQIPAVRMTKTVKIDGLLDDEAWKEATPIVHLTEFRPHMGIAEDSATRTVSYIMYDDQGIYFGGYCYERNKDSISKELVGRDGFGTNDFIGIIFDTYKDHLNGFEYFITPLNEQMDSKVSPPGQNSDNGGEDFSWNAVWKSGAVIHADGWSFEFFLPFSAIRFGKADIQDWGLNVTRRRQKTGQQYMWNPIDVNVNGFLTQEGYWTGLNKIKPPLRLQFSPYFSVYANHYPSNLPGVKNLTSQVNGGMDVKFGVTPAFTLDATLIPDFGQVQSDNQVLNLTPFEVQFNENRSFFTEGTELFSKGGLFYSRRIGSTTPIHYGDPYSNLGPNEVVIKNPSESKLINASKLSGRSQKGLGIGVLNALTNTQYATIENTTTKDQRKEMTDPLTNYNVFVLDQTLKHNSSVSLVNTNVWRSGKDYDANVTAALFDFNDKKNMYNLGGKAAVSNLIGYKPTGGNLTGYSQNLYFGKTSGRFNFNIFQDLTDTKYTHRDLGFFTNNNYIDHGVWFGYRWTKPKDWYNRIGINFNAHISHLLSRIGNIDTKFQRTDINFNMNVQTKKLTFLGIFLAYTPKQNDFYEPRVEGWYFKRGASTVVDWWFESNNAKKYVFSTENALRTFFNFYGFKALDMNIRQSYRFTQKFSVSHQFNFLPRFNSVGFAAQESPTSIIFGRRKINTVENVLSLKYNFTNKTGITFRTRHYNSSVHFKEFFTLMNDGKLNKNDLFNQNADQNVNFFNIDMVYTWQFAPGSFLNIVWKNSVVDFRDQVEDGYFRNLKNTMSADQNNNISLKVIYFLDYLQLKRKVKR